MINTIVGIIFTVIAFGFAYMTSHIIAERKAGKTIPLPWEKKSDKWDIRNINMEFIICYLGIIWYACVKRVYNRTFKIRKVYGN